MLLKLLLTKKCTSKFLCIVSIMVLMIGLLPLLLIGRYAHACADDFGYGYYPHAIWNATHSLKETLHWAFYQVKASYDTWQGTFSSIFLMALSPAVWGEEYYYMTPVIMIGVTVFSHFAFFYIILVKVLNADKLTWMIISSLFCFLLIQTMYSPVNAFYWYNGAVHYVFMHGCMLLLLAISILSGKSGKLWVKIAITLLSSFLAVICGGSNYLTALLGIICLLLIFVAGISAKRKSYWSIPLIFIYSIAFYININAYGNTIRQAYFQKLSPTEAILKSFLSANTFIIKWISAPVVLIAVLMIPLIWNLVIKSKFSFRMPLIVMILSYCLFACMFTPNFYSTGNIGPDRVINIIKMWFLLIFFLNEIYIIGYISKHIIKSSRCLSHYILFYLSIGLLLILHFKTSDNVLTEYSSYAAYVSLKTGEVRQFHEEYRDRLDLLYGSKKEVHFKPYSVKPYLLYLDDITEDPYDWRNIGMARWYDKEKVYLAE